MSAPFAVRGLGAYPKAPKRVMGFLRGEVGLSGLRFGISLRGSRSIRVGLRCNLAFVSPYKPQAKSVFL